MAQELQSRYRPGAPSAPADREGRKMDTMSRKAFTASALQLKILDYKAIMARYQLFLWGKIDSYFQYLLEDKHGLEKVLHGEAVQLAKQQISADQQIFERDDSLVKQPNPVASRVHPRVIRKRVTSTTQLGTSPIREWPSLCSINSILPRGPPRMRLHEDNLMNNSHSSTRERREKQRMQAIWEQEERERLEIARERLEIERTHLERERMERERLERERMHIEHERRREQERIQREREELRRQHEQLRYEQERRVSLRRPYDMDGRRGDPYWPESKRMAMDDRHRSDFNRQDRFHDFDNRDRGRYQDRSLDRREGSRGMMGDRDGQHYSDEHHGGPDRHSREGWGSYSSDRRMSEGRGIPPQSRDGRNWGNHSRKFDGHPNRSWQSNAHGGATGRDYERWRDRGRGRRGHVMQRGGMSGRGGFVPGSMQGQASHGEEEQDEGFSGQDRGSRPNDPRFSRRY